MAFSSSIKYAQVIKFCELCNQDSIKWRCVDCDRSICEKCKTIHLKVPATAKHQIVTITIHSQDVPQRIVTDNIPCKDHTTRMTCMFCETCDCLVCPECISTSHTKHQFIPIEKALDEKMETLKSAQVKVNNSLKVCDEKSTEIQHVISKFNSIFDESITKIKEREQELKDVISKFSKELQDNVKAERSKVKSRFINCEQQVDETRKLEDLKLDLETALTSKHGHVIFETIPTKPTLEFDCLPSKVESFVPVEEATKQIQELFGSFKEMTIPTSSTEFGFEVLRTFTTNLYSIQQVIPLDETMAWISCNTENKSGVIRKVTIQDNNIVTTNENAMGIYDMALTSDNDILMTVRGKSDVKLMRKTGKIKTFLTVKPLWLYAIHVTSDNHILVGGTEPGNPFTPTDENQRAIMVFDTKGKQNQKYQFDGNRQRLFTLPVRITTNNNQDILVRIEIRQWEGGYIRHGGGSKMDI